MKIRTMYTTIAVLLFMTVTVMAQENNQEVLDTKISKSYTINDGKKLVRNSVEITTKRLNTIEHSKDDAGKIDQDRIVDSVSTIVKTVQIDNDEDDAFDEKIVFSYESKTPEDFILVSKNNELVVAMNEGENLKIVENINLKSKELLNDKTTYIFTNERGENLEFLVQEYSRTSETAMLKN
ncbi:hypothetical protein [Maribacter hydrothermalis]|uniref:Uncharacterized protein n=1 Tax=Maribacter hydrothermalis TaxID=1836467 RepID=A0A1B7Z8P2_9FLAO|nr:hypothetical protein [Maribacter hydrothermalis]APQ18931.1 hypothetical protein BTR34_17095 [Maribacter hydrothermalis]OBR39056.1 hypothetical protein A9200_05180 [Maribacter hydrothermalis]